MARKTIQTLVDAGQEVVILSEELVSHSHSPVGNTFEARVILRVEVGGQEYECNKVIKMRMVKEKANDN